jgi:hypothetical protein
VEFARVERIIVPVILLVAFLAVGWVLTGVLYIFRIRDAGEHISFLAEAQSEFANRAIEAERARGVAETESQYMKLTLANVLQRPAVAVMTDENIQQLGAIIEGFMKAPDKMN